MPIKWMAPESLTDHILSTASDVWSYGILLWELFSLGKIPYPGIITHYIERCLLHLFTVSNCVLDIDAKQLIKELENGYRMEKPNYAPNFIGDVMSNCWKKEPKDRPTFNQLEEIVSGNMESTVSSYYSNLNAPYEKSNYEKTVAPKTEGFGLAKLLNDKPKLLKSLSQPADSNLRYSMPHDNL